MSMVNILAKQKKGLTICHLNAQSLNNKMDEFRSIFEKSAVDIICVSETWLKKCTPDNIIRLKDYKVFRNDRYGNAGGVAIYVKSHFACKLKCKSVSVEADNNENEGAARRNLVEYIFVEISSLRSKLLVGCVYRPNSRINFDAFYQELEVLTASYSDIVISGDYNCNILSDSSLTDSMAPLGLVPTNCSHPTHYTTTVNTLLDLFFVNKPCNVLLYDQISASCFSKHDLIFLTYNFNVKFEEKTYKYRDFSNINYNVLYDSLSQIDWYTIYYTPNIDDKLSFLDHNVLDLYDKSVPEKTRKVSSKTLPWFNNNISRLILQRDIAYSRWKRFKTPELKDEFRSARREVNSKIKAAKMEYYSKLFGNAVQSNQKWKIINDIGIGKPNDVGNNPSINVDDLNVNFTTLPSTTINHDFYDFNNSNAQIDQSFEFSCVSQFDVLSSLISVKSNATGSDNINPKFFKILVPFLLPFVTHIFNYIIMTSIYPSKWKQAKVVPIPKSSQEYRPIAILCFLSKVFEKILNIQIREFLSQQGLLSNMQSGFRPNHSCVSALIEVTENLRRKLEENKINFLVLLDHSKAFDTVHHQILCKKLRYLFNFSTSSTQLIASYLTNRTQFVSVCSMSSPPLSLSRGVPQGSILGPLLFSMYINDLPQQLDYCKIHMYADDVQVYLSSPSNSTNESVNLLNADLNKIHLWAMANGLFLNPSKSKCLLIHKKSIKPVIENDVLINGQKIPFVISAKNLGIVFNNNLTWCSHIKSLVSQTYAKLRTLWATQNFTPPNIRLLLAKTYVIPGLLYGAELFASCDSASRHRLNVIFNNTVRYVFGLRRYSSTSPFSSRLYGVSFDSLIKIRVILFTHKVIYSGKPKYIFNNLQFARSNRGRKLILPIHYTLVSEWQYYVNAARLWNLLPPKLQLLSHETQFKKQLFSFFQSL